MNKGKETFVLTFLHKQHEKQLLIDGGKYHFIKVSQLLNEKEVLKLDNTIYTPPPPHGEWKDMGICLGDH